MVASTRFTQEAGLIGLHGSLTARATTAAAMDSPGPFERHSTEAFYYVSPPDAGLTPDKLEEYLQVYYFSGLEIISAHETFFRIFENRLPPELLRERDAFAIRLGAGPSTARRATA